jgi:hypothetical protein
MRVPHDLEQPGLGIEGRVERGPMTEASEQGLLEEILRLRVVSGQQTAVAIQGIQVLEGQLLISDRVVHEAARTCR